MKLKLAFIITVFLMITNSFSQEIPFIKVGDDNLGITSLQVNVEIFGNVATTTYDMKFYNPTNKILEGELNFPLGENQKVVRLALDVNGNLREAVIVEKEIGRVAFEAVVRRRVDPILLEKVTGNNYKARIYPIPAKGYKRIVLAFSQVLKFQKNSQVLHIPLNFNQTLDYFKVETKIFGHKNKPIIDSNDMSLTFDKHDDNYFSSYANVNHLMDKDLKLRFPLKFEQATIIRNEHFFYLSQQIKIDKIKRIKPKKINIIWDASYSMKENDEDKTLALLDKYFGVHPNITVNLSVFSNVITNGKTFKIVNGNWNELEKTLINTTYDGGTNYKVLGDVLSKNNNPTLLFTDLMRNLDNAKFNFENEVFIINGNKKSNHSLAKKMIENNDGAYINLNELSISDALNLLIYQKFELLSLETNNDKMDIYPKKINNIANGVNVSGTNFNAGDVIKLKFGNKNKISKVMEYVIPSLIVTNNKIDKIFANHKIDFLQKHKEKNKNEIIALSKGYNVISDFTSMIVLESVYDYIKYRIEPPADLKEQYGQILKNRELGTNFRRQQESQRNNKPLGINEIRVSGVVSDDMGPVADISVKVRGTSNGTATDFDGNYSINVKIGDVLEFTHVSYQGVSGTVNGNNMNVTMSESGNSLDEVIVTAMGVSRKDRSVSYSHSVIEKKELATSSNVVSALQGRIAGVRVFTQNGAVGSNTRIVMRGNTSLSKNNNALIVMDGIPQNENFNINDLNTSNIESVNVIKGASATAIYGSRAANGVIIITMKNGETNYAPNNDSETDKDIALKIDYPKNGAAYLLYYKNLNSATSYYETYLSQRFYYKDHPAYFVDIYDLFKEQGYLAYADRILSNLIEIDIDNEEKLKIFAYKLEENNQYELAVIIYEKILELRPEDAQSYRDLALANTRIKNYELASKYLNGIINGDVYKNKNRRRFRGVETIAKNELTNILSTTKFYKNKEQYKQFTNDDMFDVRVVIEWNHNDTDMDLHIIEPTREECYYGHRNTKIGGRMSEDLTQGFGPEEYILKNAVKGKYYVKVKYYGDRYQKIENPTFVKVTIFRNYGKKNQSSTVKIIRLSGKSKAYVLAEIDV